MLQHPGNTLRYVDYVEEVYCALETHRKYASDVSTAFWDEKIVIEISGHKIILANKQSDNKMTRNVWCVSSAQ